MTTDLTRPPDVDPRRWYDPRTPWYARKQASDAWKRANRDTEVTYETLGRQKDKP